MSDITSTSCCRDNRNDKGNNSMFMILILLLLCGGDNGIFGCSNGNNGIFSCSNDNNECGCNNGLSGMLPILLMLLSGGSF